MTKKEEANLKRAAKLEAEKERTNLLKSYERNVKNSFFSMNEHPLICGIDEAGRGPFAGPVVAGAVILDLDDPEKEILYLNDSKKLSEKKRELLYHEIFQKAIAVGVGYAGSVRIDQINILQATYEAMRQAIANLTAVSHLEENTEDTHELVKKLIQYELPEAVHVNRQLHDRIQPDYVLADAVTIPGIQIPQQGIIKGDAKSISIAAGSIIAKVTRDHIMYEYDKQYPQYAFASNKGYGTAAHIAAIKEYGMIDIHRRSFIHL